MNKADSERIASVLEENGYLPADNKEKANLLFVNMCSVRQSAVDRVYGLLPLIERLKKKEKNFRAILTGCVLKKDKKKFQKGFDFFLPIKSLPSLGKILQDSNFSLPDSAIRERKADYLEIKAKYSNDFSAFLPISTGCNNACTYCAVPFTRGPLVCRNHLKIIQEAKELIKKGFKEIWLLGQNVNDYYSPQDRSYDFAHLIEDIERIDGNFWLRFTAPNPKDFNSKLIEVMGMSRKLTPYLNLPLQSGDNLILKRMNRGYSVEQYEKLVREIRRVFWEKRKGLEREISLSTDIIVGFPGESKEAFQNTLSFFQKMQFEMAYIAKFSPRPQTLAAKMKNDVPSQEKERRRKLLTDALRKMALKANERFVGKVIKVLVEKEEKGFLFAKSRHFKTVRFKGSKGLVGQFVNAKILKALPWGLEGKIS